MLMIRSTAQSFRRAGTQFTNEATLFPDGHFTPEQLAELMDEPMLVVQQVEQPLDTDGTEQAQAREVLGGMTNDRLKADCDAMGIAYPANATKAQLIDLILANTVPAPEA